MAEQSSLLRLVALWQERVGRREGRVVLAAVLLAVVIGASLGRLGTPPARLGALVLLAAVLIGGVVRRVLVRRALGSVEGVVRRVLVPTDPALGHGVLRAHALVGRTERDPQAGSAELARLHFTRTLGRVSFDAVERVASARARRLSWLAAVPLLGALAGIVFEPMRIVEGLDVLAARGGVAPIPLDWLDGVKVVVQPPSYLRQSERPLYPSLRNDAPLGSVVTVRGRPLREGRRLVLSDGASEQIFVDDGAGGVVARWTLEKSLSLRVAARFGEVLIREPGIIEIEAVSDAPPKVVLEEAPRTLALRELDRIEFRYQATDDHGLRQVDFVMRSGGREERRVLERLDGESKLRSGAHAIDARDAFLRRMFLPVVASIEARDNDAPAGMKWGKSAAVTIVPPAVGEPEALRYAGLGAALTPFLRLLDHRMQGERPAAANKITAGERSAAGGRREHEEKAAAQRARREEDKALRLAAVEALKKALADDYGGAEVSSKMEAFALGQLEAFERPGEPRRRVEDLVIAFDAALRTLAQGDAQRVSKRLGDVAEEIAIAAESALFPERRAAGLERIDAASGVLNVGAGHLLTLGTLGADIGDVAQSEMRRIGRARQAGRLLEVELAARHLAARLRRPVPSFRSAGGGGGSVESGQGKGGGEPGEPSQADKQFDQLMQELAELAAEHAEAIRGVEGAMADAESGADDAALRSEAARRAEALRSRADDLPEPGSRQGSARAAAALAREHLGAMAQHLERLALGEAVDSGRKGGGALDDAKRIGQSPQSAADLLDQEAIDAAGAELAEQLAWAEKMLEERKKRAAERAAQSLAEQGKREEELGRRAGNLAGRGAHSEARLPEDLADALERAESAMQQAARELGTGRGEEGLALQREAQRLLERASAADEPDEGSEGRESHGADGGKGGPAMQGEVPEKRDESAADEFRKRVLDGLSGERRGRLGPAVERYAEGLLE